MVGSPSISYLLADRFLKPIPVIVVSVLMAITGGFGYFGRAYFTPAEVYALFQSVAVSCL